MSDQKSKPLRLRAQDMEDLAPLSSLMQDAIVLPSDLKFDAPARRFAIAANRFRWEREDKRRGLFGLRERPSRVRTILRFDYVNTVKSRGFDETSALPLNILTVTAEPADPHVQILLIFSSGIDIALGCETIDATLDDVSAPWSVDTIPRHDG
ncbi:MAG: DUF2948 family protein [Pseudomonadota bacterium]